MPRKCVMFIFGKSMAKTTLKPTMYENERRCDERRSWRDHCRQVFVMSSQIMGLIGFILSHSVSFSHESHSVSSFLSEGHFKQFFFSEGHFKVFSLICQVKARLYKVLVLFHFFLPDI